MGNNILNNISQWWLLIVVVAALFGCAEVGFRCGRRADAISEEAYPHVSTIESALLGLLALLLGFAFSMAMSRYDTRKSFFLNEANDLGTAYLRAQLLPEPVRKETITLLRDYVKSRIAFVDAGNDLEQSAQAIAWSNELQGKLWSQAAAAARIDNSQIPTGYFIQSLNEVIDDHTRRMIAMEDHVPALILFLLIFVASMTLAMTGYSSGLNKVRLLVPRTILAVLTATTLMVIVDLDRPRRGLIRVSESALIQLNEKIASDFAK